MGGCNDTKNKEIESFTNIIKHYENQISILEFQLKQEKEKEFKIIEGLINILDSTSSLLNNTIYFSNNDLKKQVEDTKRLINRELRNIKVINSCTVGELFNENYEICVGYTKNKELADNTIIKVVKEGYIFKDEVIRLGEVIVVKNDTDMQ